MPVLDRKSNTERKVISVSSKRQITIPQKYFETLGFSNEAECSMVNGGIFIRPVRASRDDFSEEILSDLIAQGYSGDDLLKRFKEESRKVRSAVRRMLDDAKDAANGSSQYDSYDDIFGSEEDE